MGLKEGPVYISLKLTLEKVDSEHTVHLYSQQNQMKITEPHMTGAWRTKRLHLANGSAHWVCEDWIQQ